ncbi:mucin-2-like [Ylistrum balloti]|uniref:mucin-2-like n=1 Tax=Ylistrum balloti TaxID=509963 RepID=UPI0029058404|nr:mucin-2-like [Ylistrum balloti]
MIILLSVTFALVVSCKAQLCEDVDSALCKDIFSLNPRLCSTDCFSSSICPRTCGKCPLKCYDCHEVTDPNQCNKTSQCPSPDHFCITAESFNDDFKVTYKLGCALNSICAQHIVPTLKRRDNAQLEQIQLKGTCCANDLCNIETWHVLTRPPPSLTSPNTSQPTSSVSKPSTSSLTSIQNITSGQCDDINANICSRLQTLIPDMCSNDCIANEVCPRRCGKCIRCYECSHVPSSDRCSKTTVCGRGEQCLSVETISAAFVHGFKLGCMDERLCSTFGQSAPATFGKRQGYEIYIHGGCCKGELCNHHVVQPSHSEPPTKNSTTPPTINTATSSISTVPSTTKAPRATTSTLISNISTTTTTTPTIPSAFTATTATTFILPSTTTATTATTSTLPPTTSTTLLSTRHLTADVVTSTLIPCEDYDKSGYCDQFVPLICLSTDPMSQKFALANCALSCKFCDKFHGEKFGKEKQVLIG